MRTRDYIFATLILLLIASQVSGFTLTLTCSSTSLSSLASCVNSNFKKTETDLNSLQSQVTALSTKVTALQQDSTTSAGMVGSYSLVASGTALDDSGGSGLNITSTLTQSTLMLNSDMSFSMSQTKNETALGLNATASSQSSTDGMVTVASSVVTNLASSLTPTQVNKTPTGTWSYSAGSLTLTPTAGGNPISFTVGSNGRILMLVDEANSVWVGIKTP